MRLSFRLDESEDEIWLRLRQDNLGRTDKYIFQEMLRREDYRMQGNSKDDRLNEIKALLVELKDMRGIDTSTILMRLMIIEEKLDAPNDTDHA